MPFEARNIARLRNIATRSISPENVNGTRGGGGRATQGTGANAARDLGVGWKMSPSIVIGAGTTFPLATIDGGGTITHIWLTTNPDYWRTLVLRAYWDDAPEPAVEVPVGDFFANGWGRFAQVSSTMIAANPYGGFNSYWPMPFQRGARLTVQNLSDANAELYYQVTYETDLDVAGFGYLHAQFRRNNPLSAGTTHVLLDGVVGQGHYVGTYLAWGANSPGWWGEGELKMYVDGDEDYPTICGTGTEDYFGGAWSFDVPGRGYTEYTTPYLGMPQVIRPDGFYQSQQRFGLYRWHVLDPIHFASDLRVEIQALGWQAGGRYLPLHDDIASTAFFYLDRPSTKRPSLPDVDALRIG
jgi:D-arabinan exo alpha-(1,3)/(1,5)-arabinofuranosidase (non-reducing end)